MLLCDDFVFIHYPKTGGTFVTDVLSRLLRARGRPFVNTDKHEPCRDIPATHTGRPICACIRNPYDLKVSQFRYRLWEKMAPPACVVEVRKRFPRYPALSFAEFVEVRDLLSHDYLVNSRRNGFIATLGQYTQRFLWTFLRDYENAVPALDEDALNAERMRSRLYPVRFLHTDRLNRDLFDFLREVGYPAEPMRFILAEGKILPPGGTRTDADDWRTFYTPEIKARVRDKERLLFRLFPEFDV